jgi:dihydropteroate synthase
MAKCNDKQAMFTLNCKGRLVSLDKPLVMGILNVTPDSFYEGSRFVEMGAILAEAEKMIREGADMLDIGGQSTRPGAKRLGVNEELQRVIKVVAGLHDRFPETILSIDTYYAKVAMEALTAGASMVNDISGGKADTEMLTAVGKKKVPYICMHMQGDVDTMHQQLSYQDLTREVLDHFIERRAACIQAGINDIIFDPGFGFSKTIEHNFELLKNLGVFSILESPLLVGLSRKSTIYKTLGIGAADALNGSSVLNTIALMNGAQILRVHDVKEAKEVVTLVTAMRGKGA